RLPSGGGGAGGAAPSDFYVAWGSGEPRGKGHPRRSLFHRGVKGAFDLEYIVLTEPVDLDDGARRVGSLAPELLLDLVHQRPKSNHVGHVDDDAPRLAPSDWAIICMLRKPCRMRASSPGTRALVLGSIPRMPAM